MKQLFVASLFCFFATSAMAASKKGVSADAAQNQVIKAAHAQIKAVAPDFGGSVKSPCETDLSGDAYTVTCHGIANETIGGGGEDPTAFSCVGKFTQGQDGLFYKDSINCDFDSK